MANVRVAPLQSYKAADYSPCRVSQHDPTPRACAILANKTDAVKTTITLEDTLSATKTITLQVIVSDIQNKHLYLKANLADLGFWTKGIK